MPGPAGTLSNGSAPERASNRRLIGRCARPTRGGAGGGAGGRFGTAAAYCGPASSPIRDAAAVSVAYDNMILWYDAKRLTRLPRGHSALTRRDKTRRRQGLTTNHPRLVLQGCETSFSILHGDKIRKTITKKETAMKKAEHTKSEEKNSSAVNEMGIFFFL